MQGISSKALGKPENKFKYNGKELQHNEFSDGSGLEEYDYGARMHDPQIGRFPQLDPMTDRYATLTPYQYADNDPITNIDRDGLEGATANAVGSASRDFSYGISAVSDMSQFIRPADFVARTAQTAASAAIKVGVGATNMVLGIVSMAIHTATAASKRLMPPLTLLRKYLEGLVIDSPTSAWAAKWITAWGSAARKATKMDSRSLKSP